MTNPPDDVDDLLLKGRYEQALSASVQAAAEPQNGMLIGAPLDVGVALLMLGRLEEAKRQFQALIAGAIYRVSQHRIYLGLAYWGGGEDEQAIAIWQQALRSQYARSSGLDVHFTLSHASACRPDLLSNADVTKGIEKHLSRFKTGFVCRVAEFLIGRISKEEVNACAKDETGHYVAERIQSNLAMLEFALSTERLQFGDIPGYRRHLKKCASVEDCPDELFEIFFSRIEHKDNKRRVSRYNRAKSL